MTVPEFTLNNGVPIPALGFGVFQTPPDETIVAVTTALEKISNTIRLTKDEARSVLDLAPDVRAPALRRRRPIVTTRIARARRLAAPALTLAMFLALPSTSELWERGGWWSFLGVVLSFLAAWLVLTPVLIWVYRYVAPGRPRWLSTVLVGSFTAANLSGFLHGFVLFCSFPLDLGAPFGGFDEIGGMVAVGLWLYLFHVIVLAGYAATRSASAYQIRRGS